MRRGHTRRKRTYGRAAKQDRVTGREYRRRKPGNKKLHDHRRRRAEIDAADDDEQENAP